MAKVIFLHLSVILFTGGVLPQCMLGYQHPPRPGRHPPRGDPPEQTPPWTRQTPPGPGRHPPGADTPPDQADPPHRGSIRSTSGRYASYWNAFLFFIYLPNYIIVSMCRIVIQLYTAWNELAFGRLSKTSELRFSRLSKTAEL